MQTTKQFFNFSLLCLFLLAGNLSAQNYFANNGGCIEGATISVAFTGETEINTCSGDDLSDRVRFATDLFNMAYGYVVVDANDIIVSIGFSNFVDFDMLPNGVLRVYSFSNYGLITASVGDVFSTATLAEPCFGLSGNFVTVNNAGPGETEIASATGETEFSVCPGDGIADIITVTATGALPNIAYIITDSEGVVLGVNDDGVIDFDDAGNGVCRIYGFSYGSSLNVAVGDVLSELTGFGCGGPSAEFITVTRAMVNGGSVAIAGGGLEARTCPGDGVADEITFENTGAAGSNLAYIVTDADGIIIGLPASEVIDFEGAGTGACLVWTVAYEGELTAMLGDNAAEVDLATGCFDLSDNFVTVIREVPVGGTVATTDGETEIASCPGDGIDDIFTFAATGQDGGASTYVVTDADGIVLGVPPANEINFEDAGTGTCRVYVLTYQGELSVVPGDDINGTLATSCFELSDNFVNVIRTTPEGGTVATVDGETELTTCPGDGLDDLVSFTSTGATGSNQTYVVTDANNIILGIPEGNEVNFEDAGVGACRVWVLAYEGEILAQVGDDAAATRLASACFSLSDNFVTVNRIEVIGGTVATVDGETEVQTCPGDGIDDLISFTNTGGSDLNFTYVVTDADGTILSVPAGNEVNFEGAGEGACRLYGLTYLGDLQAAMDGNINDALATGCFALSDNFVTVLREVPTGGTILTESGQSQVVTCPGDMVDDIVTVAFTGNTGGTTSLIVTDSEGIVLALPPGNSVNLEDAGVGTCRIYSVTYQGELTVVPGDDVNNVDLATSCFALSEDFVTAVRDVPTGGTVSTVEGETEVTICSQDDLEDVISFANVGGSASSLAYLITDENNVILAISESGDLDFTGAELGVCRVWTVTYEGIILAQVGDNAAEVRVASLCYSLSDNFVTVNRVQAAGGTVATENGETMVSTCPGDGIEDVFTFVSTGATAGLNFTYVVTDADNNILGVPGGATIDFDNAGGGACRVWGLSYDGEIVASPGENAAEVALASGCFALSDNFVTVNRIVPTGGTVSLESGEMMTMTCPNDGIPDIVSVDSTGTSQERFTYIITDENNVILSLPFGDNFNLDGAGLGTCRIWGVGYDGVFIAQPGDTAGVNQLATDCFVLTENFVTVLRERPAGGTVSTEDGETDIFICPLDDLSDVISFDSLGATGGSFTYVVTDSNNIILGLPDGDEVDFATAGIGVCRLWGLSYQGELIAQAGDDAGVVQLADGCFSLSENFVTVTRDDVDGGTVATTIGSTMVTTCPGDGIDDIVFFTSDGANGPNFTYVVTDENNFILSVPEGNSQNFDDAGEGICRVWGLSYAGDISAMVGDNAANVDLATGCFALSDNFITVVRTQPEGGLLSVDGSTDTIMLCSGDMMGDVTMFDVADASPGNYSFIVAQDGFVLTALPSSTFDFNNAQPGVYTVYGLAYAGSLSFIPGDPIFDTELATSCFDLSDNGITFEIERVDGCEIQANGTAGPVYLCPQNPNDGIVEFSTCSDVNDQSYTYIITSTDGIILTLIEGNVFDFSFVPLPEFLVYGVSYTGELMAVAGTNINGELSSECFSLSENFIEFANDSPEAGVISFGDEINSDFYCVANGMSSVAVNTTSSSAAGYVILVTDENDIVQLISDPAGVDVSTLPEGDYRFYGLSYTGNVTVEVGDDLALVALADNCFELTTDFLTFTRGGDINGGIINIQTNQDTFYVCPMDGNPDLVLVNSTITGVPYRYLVTDQNGDILIPDIFSNVINFEDAPEGICRIYGYAFTGNVTATFGVNIADAQLSDSCFALSENFIVAVRQRANAGSISTIDGETQVTVDIDSDETTVEFASSGAADLINFTYVITDENNIILGIGEGPTFDFADAGVGNCRVWGLSYQGELTAEAGNDAADVDFATSCFDLTDSFVTVIRTGDGIDDNDDVSALTMTPYPNPVSGSELQVIFNSETPLTAGQAFVLDQNGRAWATTNVAGGSTTTVVNFDISNLPTGLFVVQYRSGDRQEVVRFIRQ